MALSVWFKPMKNGICVAGIALANRYYPVYLKFKKKWKGKKTVAECII